MLSALVTPPDDKEIGHLFRHLQGDIDLRFGGGGAQMRGADEIGRAKQRVIGCGRFAHEHVQRGPGDMAAVEASLQRHFIHQPAARAVDDPHALLGLGQPFGVEDVAGLVGQRGVQGDEIRACQQRIEIGLFHAHFHRAFRRQERVIGHHLHPQAHAPGWRRCEPILPAPIRPSVLPVTSTPMKSFFGHLPVLGLRIGFRQLPGEREHQRDGVFGGGDRIAERRVHHHDALGAGGGDIDIVHADPGAADHFEIGRGIQHIGRGLGGGPDGKAVILADAGDQFFLGHAGLHIHIAAVFGENAGGIGVHLVGNENFGLGHGHTPSPLQGRGPGRGECRRPALDVGRNARGGSPLPTLSP